MEPRAEVVARAEALVGAHGRAAEAEAKETALALRDRRDYLGVSFWNQVLARIARLRRHDDAN